MPTSTPWWTQYGSLIAFLALQFTTIIALVWRGRGEIARLEKRDDANEAAIREQAHACETFENESRADRLRLAEALSRHVAEEARFRDDVNRSLGRIEGALGTKPQQPNS